MFRRSEKPVRRDNKTGDIIFSRPNILQIVSGKTDRVALGPVTFQTTSHEKLVALVRRDFPNAAGIQKSKGTSVEGDLSHLVTDKSNWIGEAFTYGKSS